MIAARRLGGQLSTRLARHAMEHRTKQWILALSLATNLLVALPAVAVFALSGEIRFNVYQHLQSRFGEPDIVFIGDSLTLGGGLWGFRIGEYGFGVWNLGQSGLTTRQIQPQARTAASRESVRYAFVMAGTNDEDKTAEGAEESFADYKVIIDTLIEGGVTPIVQLTLYRENDRTSEFVDRLNALLVRYANQRMLNVIDLNAVLAPEKSLLPQYSADGVHLTEAAYAVWAAEVKAVLEEIRSG